MICIGKIVNTHGLKGEVKIISDFKYKNLVFKKNFVFHVNNEKLIVKSYRKHKMFDMVTFDLIDDINNVLKYKGKDIYINREDIKEKIILNEDYIGLEVYSDRYIGIVEEIMKNPAHDILVVNNNGKINLIPNVEEFVKSVDVDNKKIIINEIEGLIDED